MEVIQVDHGCAAELYSADFVGRCASAGVIPGTDDQEMLRSCFRRSGVEMVAIIGQRANFVAIILAGDGKNRKSDFCKLSRVGTIAS